MKPIKNKKVFAFKKGQIKGLDQIYDIQGLFSGAGNDWWEPLNDMDNGGGAATGEQATQASGENVIITRDITIEIIER